MRSYEISAGDRITAVSEDWDIFARGNGGEAALRRTVMGRPLWDFVAGLETRAYLNALFFAARTAGEKVAVRYRCDGPADRRYFQLQIQPIGAGGLRLSQMPLDVVPRLRPAEPPPRNFSCCCAQCLRCKVGEDWIGGEVYHGFAPGPVEYVVCPQCRGEAQRVIEAVLSSRRVH